MSELKESLAQVPDIAARTEDFQAHEASYPKAFSKSVVEDPGTLAHAVSVLIKRAEP
ncbi:hypothetical protein [Salinibacterium sp.]|uniref:hypothetical protein n=1 Tax=Salinibacterium sp. TaxID=1915057 RepID=UPI00286AC6A5|nr:hypothetical protein [Salinibacterium sp.]